MSNTSTGERVACDPADRGYLWAGVASKLACLLMLNWHECRCCLNINS